VTGERHERGGADAGPQIKKVPGAVACGRAEQHRIETGAKAIGRLGNGQGAPEKRVGCDVGAFYNRRRVG
jgi:hypothetical protein